MKNRVICFMISLVLMLSVIPNAVMADDDGAIYGWKASRREEGKTVCEVSTDYFCSGKHSLLMKVSEDSSSAQVSTDVTVEKGKSYKVSFYAKVIAASNFSCAVGNAKYSLVSVMSKYNWTKFSYTYTHTDDSSVVQLAFEISKKGQVYIDGVSFVPAEPRGAKNMIKNPGFELTPSDAAAGDAEGSVVSIEQVFGSFDDKTAMPVLYADNIAIDGDGSEWNGYTGASVPPKGSSVSTITGYQGEKDLSSIFRTAYDEEYFYVYGEVTDDKHVQTADGSGYWREDSIQVVLSTVEEDYGVEIGFYLLENGEAKFYCEELEKTEWGAVAPEVVALREKMKFKASRTGDKTIYEAAIPWGIKFDGMPDSFLLDILVDDNDGSGRKGYAEWKEGIGKTKSNEEFVAVYPIPKGNNVFGYLDGAKSVYEGETQNYTLYICNTNESETEVQADETVVAVPAESVCRMPVSMSAEEIGTQMLEVPLQAGQDTYVARKSVPVKRNLELAFPAFRDNQLAELHELAGKCSEEGINTDYEDINITTIEKFIDYGLEDWRGGRESRAAYVYDCLEKLYEEVKTTLTEYLNHTKTPIEASYYEGGGVSVENQAFFEEHVNPETGETELRPVFFSGYLDNSRQSEEISEFGSNMLQFELLMSGYIGKPNSIRGWTANSQGGAKGSFSYDSDTVYKGDYSLKLSNGSALASNVYCNLVQKVRLEAGKTYQMSFYVKADGANGCYFRPNGWKAAKLSLSGSYDWKKVTYNYTPETTGDIEFMFISENVTNALYIDNIKVVEKGTKTNLIKHGGFEEKPVVINGYSVNVDRVMTEVIPALDEAEKNNVGVDLLMSVHYFPTNIMDEAEYSGNQTGFIKYDIFKEQPRAVTEAFFKGVIPLVSDHPALRSVCISNEPTYRVGRDESNSPAWHEYLSELYGGDVSKMNETYHESFESFDDVPLSESYENMAIYYDYLRFNDKMFADWHKWLASMVKEVAPGVKVHAKIMSVINQTDTAGSGQSITRGTNPELFAEFSDLNGNDAWNFIASSRTMLVKNLWYDFLTSIKNVPVFNSEDHVIEDRDERYTEQYAPHIATDLWQGAVHGRSASTQWKWERSLSTTSSASGNIKHRPDAVAMAGQTMLDLNRLAPELVKLQNVSREVGIFYSYPSRVHNTTHLNGVYNAYQAVSYNGQRSKIVTETMLEENKLDSVKLLIVPNVTNTNVKAVEAIRDFMKQGGKVLLIGDCMLKDAHGNSLTNTEAVEYIKANAIYVAAQSDEGGTRLIAEKALEPVVKDILQSMGMNEIELIDAKTGMPVSNTDWTYTENDGGILLNLCLYDWTEGRSISIKKNGVVCTDLTELRTGEQLADVFEVKSYTPMLIQIKQ